MTLEYAQPAYLAKGCGCNRHALHRIYSYLWKHPNTPLILAAKELHANYGTLKKDAFRLRRLPDISRRCPLCFAPTLEGLACRNCGAELDIPTLPEGIRFEDTSPVHTIQPLGGLGSSTDYMSLRFSYGGRNLQHLIEHPADSFVESCKSRLWQELKSCMPDDQTVEEANRLLLKEIAEFRAAYPRLTRAKGAGEQLVANVVSRLALRYPALRKGGKVA